MGYNENRSAHPFRNYFFANEIFIACEGVILKPWRASFAAADCSSFSNSTKAMSWRFGTSRTSLKPGNLWANKIHNFKVVNCNRSLDVKKSTRNLLVEQHWKHHLTCFIGKVCQEENLVRWLFRYWSNTCKCMPS